MQKEDINLETNPNKKEPALSLYTEEEIEGVSTTSSWTKSDSIGTGEVNFSEVSSTSEDTYQPHSTSNKSIFMELYEEDIVDSRFENVSSMKNDTSLPGNSGDSKKPNPGLSLLGEYADSGNDTEEETLSSLRAKREKHNETEETSNNKNSNTGCASTEEVHDENKTSKMLGEPDVIDSSGEVSPAVNKISSPVVEKTEDGKDVDAHELLADSLAKFKRSVSKEEGQISADSDSSDGERSSESRKDSKKRKDVKKDKSRKKDKKKKKKKKRKQKHPGEKKEPDATEEEEKKDRTLTRSRSRESSEKRKSLKPSRSRSRDRDSRRRHRSRSRSQDKAKWPRRPTERSGRSRSRSTGHRRSATNRNSDLKSRSRSPKRSVSPSSKRKERKDRRSPTSRSRRESPSSRRRKGRSRSRSPRRSSERRRSRSPRRRSRSQDRRRRLSPERSSSRKERSPNKRERKGTPSPPRKASYRTSSASDSLDSGHFTNIPLSKTNKPDELVLDNKDSVQNSPPNSEKPTAEKQEPSVFLPKPTDLEKQYSPTDSPAKPWEDEFDFVFTERMSPREGTEKSVEDVIFGSEAKTPDFKRPATGESKKSKPKESQQNEKKEDSKAVKLTGTTALADKENNLPKKMENQNGSSKPAIKTDKNSMSTSKNLKPDVLASKTTKPDAEIKTDNAKKTGNNSSVSAQTSNSADKSAFVQSKVETIPFLDEASSAPPNVSDVGLHKAPPTSQLGILGTPPTGLPPTLSLPGRTWMGLGEVGLLPTPGSLQNINFNKNEIDKAKTNTVTRKDEGRNNFDTSPIDMEMSSPEGDIIDQMNEEFWKQQQQNRVRKTENEDGKSRDVLAEFVGNEQSLVEEPYEPGSGPVIGEESEEDLNSITDPKERRKREKQQEKEKTKVQELIDKLHRQARVEEEVKHALKAYYKHRDINKEEYKSILRRAVPQVTNSSSAIDPERIRSLVKKYVAKIKGQRVNSD